MKLAVWLLLGAAAVSACSTNSKPVPEDVKKQGVPVADKSATDSKRAYGSDAMSGNAPAKGPADIMNQAANAPSSPTMEPSASGAAGSAAGLAFKAPEGWKQVPPASQMRAAQLSLPAAGGEAPEMVLFFFGSGTGGGTQDNIERWIGQVQQPDGSSSKAKAKSAERTVGGLKITTVVVDGNYASGGMMGQPTVMKENFRLWGAVVEGPGGPWFWKCTGPKAAMEAQGAAFDAFLASLIPAH